MPAPGLQVDLRELVFNSLLLCIRPAPERLLWPWWRAARLGPHKSAGLAWQTISVTPRGSRKRTGQRNKAIPIPTMPTSTAASALRIGDSDDGVKQAVADKII